MTSTFNICFGYRCRWHSFLLGHVRNACLRWAIIYVEQLPPRPLTRNIQNLSRFPKYCSTERTAKISCWKNQPQTLIPSMSTIKLKNRCPNRASVPEQGRSWHVGLGRWLGNSKVAGDERVASRRESSTAASRRESSTAASRTLFSEKKVIEQSYPRSLGIFCSWRAYTMEKRGNKSQISLLYLVRIPHLYFPLSKPRCFDGGVLSLFEASESWIEPRFVFAGDLWRPPVFRPAMWPGSIDLSVHSMVASHPKTEQHSGTVQIHRALCAHWRKPCTRRCKRHYCVNQTDNFGPEKWVHLLFLSQALRSIISTTFLTRAFFNYCFLSFGVEARCEPWLGSTRRRPAL